VLSAKGTSVFLHATDETSRAIEDLQFTLGEGPCIDAARSGEPVLVPDLAASADELSDRWPTFLSEVVETDARALFAFPIQVAGYSLGILDLYRRTPGELGPEQIALGQSGVEAMGETLLSSSEDDGVTEPSYPLTVHRAAGMVMVQLGTTVEEALVRIRATAFLEGALVVGIATEILEGRRRFTKEER
jgi:hypothetical protein